VRADPMRVRCGHVPAVVTAMLAGGLLALLAGGTAAQQGQTFDDVEIETIHVRDGVYMLVGAGGNTTVQAGPEGVLVVDTQFAPLSGKILEAIRRISDQPIRYVVNTHMHPDHIGGNEAISRAGRTRAGGNVVGDIGSSATERAAIIAHENVLTRLSRMEGPNRAPFEAWPTETFFVDQRDMLFNGEAVQMFHQPNAHTDGDILVFFRRSDVVVTGDLFTTVMYPFIDRANGGSVTGYIQALNAIIRLTVPSNVNEGGTMVIPGHGRLSDEQGVIEYRNMLTIIRDRIATMIERGMSLEQVQEARPTLDWDPRYGSDTGFWTTTQFVATIYEELAEAHTSGSGTRRGGE
jgi:cyclase